MWGARETGFPLLANFMKVHLIIKDLGGGQPVIQINGTTGGIHTFIWDKARSAHVKTYDVSDPAVLKLFRAEQVAILNQRLMWPVLVDVDVHNEECGMGNVELDAAQRAITELKAEVSALKEKLLQDGAAVARRVHTSEAESSNLSPATPELTRGQRAAATRSANRAKG